MYHFEWHRDKRGYEIRSVGGDGNSLLASFSHEYVVGLGGPLDAYRPLEEHPALWRQFAQECVTRDGIIPFANRFGIISEMGGHRRAAVDSTITMAEVLAAIAKYYDKGDRPVAAEIFNERAHPHLTAKLIQTKKGIFALKPTPLSLSSAMLIQIAEALSGDYDFRKCLNCPEWMRLGVGSHSSRRLFCSDRCRVAYYRKTKRGAAA